MLHRSFCQLLRHQDSSIIGANVPSFRNYPYKAIPILHLYRDFWRLIMRYPPNERSDLIFRLRNEFRNKRNLGHPRMVTSAYKRGLSLLEMYKSRIEFSEAKASGFGGRSIPGGKTNKKISISSGGNPDALWEHIQSATHGVLPGLRNYRNSMKIEGQGYVCNLSQQNNTKVRR
eukprot:Tbor_TRINITY_DN5184_c2_g10::TRINITY_DN5184_c2_g10_i1::g.25858::m.25858